MGMLELVVRSRLGRDGNNHTSSSLVTHKDLYNIYKACRFIFLPLALKTFLRKVKSKSCWFLGC